jgi:hypothetical protein
MAARPFYNSLKTIGAITGREAEKRANEFPLGKLLGGQYGEAALKTRAWRSYRKNRRATPNYLNLVLLGGREGIFKFLNAGRGKEAAKLPFWTKTRFIADKAGPVSQYPLIVTPRYQWSKIHSIY